MKICDKNFQRAKEVLYLEKIKTNNGIENVLSSEIYYVLKQYFDIDDKSYTAHVHTEKDGALNISFTFKAKRLFIKKETMAE
ncbi:MAG: hypothetical protein IJS74_02430 [Clostridia bacterium]|nr:hypothetical protein [Clostridia bacterium]